MPLKDFECLDCKYVFEELIKHNEKLDELLCPKCDSKDLQMMLSIPGGYQIYGGVGSSTRPRYAGSFRKDKK